MAFGIGNIGNVIEDFTNSFNEIFGKNTNSPSSKGGSVGELFDVKVGGSVSPDFTKWVGNAKGRKVKYGFARLQLDDVRHFSGGGQPEAFPAQDSNAGVYYLDIPPQAITQKEIFANNISATRKGIIVETEGVVFKDIIIQGTTGVFPGQRGGANTPKANFSDFSKPPSPAAGVNAEGRSEASGIKTISGYEEFLRLRQFFLKYAKDKVDFDGDLFLIFINEKDDQNLIVEPLEFTMERSSKSPMTYNYKIVLKAIGNLNAVFAGIGASPKEVGGLLGTLQDVGNIAANTQAAIQQGRAVLNQSTRLLRRISESVDQTVNGTLRQVEFASGDLADGLSTVLALPEILARNATESVLTTKENLNDAAQSVFSSLGLGGTGFQATTTSTSGATFNKSDKNSSDGRAAQAADFTAQREIEQRIQEDTKIPVPRSFIEDNRNEVKDLSDNLADFIGLGDPLYDTIKGRVVTNIPDALKVPSDEEILALGAMQNITDALNQTLATNVSFSSDAEVAFEQQAALFQDDDIAEDQQVRIKKPLTVREVRIENNDTLERIAQREYNDALRWLDIVVLNRLKPPYISADGGDGVKKPGEIILIGDS